MMVFRYIIIKAFFLKHNVLETLDGINECVADYAFMFMMNRKL